MAALDALLPVEWQLNFEGLQPGQFPAPDADLWLTLQGDRASGELLVEVRSRVTPLDARRLVELHQQATRLSRRQAALLVIAPWLSRTVQQILREGEVAYLDLTDNVFLHLRHPAVFIRTVGATQDPNPTPSEERRALSGSKAGRLVRLLVDATPPVRPVDLARAADLSPGYVTRLLTTLADQGLIRRGHRAVEKVDWEALLRARAEQIPSLLRPGSVVTLLAPQGIGRLLEKIQSSVADQTLVTGSYAAAKLAPVTVGGQLMLYPKMTDRIVGDPAQLATHLQNFAGALPTDRGADVVVLTASDPVAVRWGARQVDGLWHVAPSQLALDCLTGNGRMPAEGEAVLEHMAATEKEWRASSFEELLHTARYFRGQTHPGVKSPPPSSDREQV